MAESYHRIILIFFIALGFIAVSANVCISQNPCFCQLNDYSKVDLTSLTSKLGKNFLTAIAPNRITYYFHGCQDGSFTYTPLSNNTNNTTTISSSLFLTNVTQHLSIKNNTLTVVTETNVIDLGKSNQIFFDAAPDNKADFQIVYISNVNQSTPSIRLICDDFQEDFLRVMDSSDSSHRLVLSSPLVCLQKTHPGLSTGSVLLILFFFGFATYLICGMLLLYFMRGARGVEVIPNIDFWKSLPGLVKDGLVYLLSGCRPTVVSASESYDRI